MIVYIDVRCIPPIEMFYMPNAPKIKTNALNAPKTITCNQSQFKFTQSQFYFNLGKTDIQFIVKELDLILDALYCF